jgi:EpsI family protein
VGRRELLGFAFAVVLLAGLPALSTLLRNSGPPPAYAQDAPLVVPPSWSVRADPPSVWVPVFSGADEETRAAFADANGEVVEFFRARFFEQRQGAELVGETSSLFGEYLRPIAEQDMRSAAGVFRETELAAKGDGRSLVWSRYVIGRRTFVRGVNEQLWYGFSALFHRPSASVVALRVECAADCEGARAVLHEFTGSTRLN